MKFPRSARMLRSQFDVAPYAAVFFAMLILLMVMKLLPVPGLETRLTPPTAGELAGVEQPTIAVAIDVQGRLYYENQIISEQALTNTLADAVKSAPLPLTLVIQADQAVSYGQLARLTLLARESGITNALLATLPSAKP